MVLVAGLFMVGDIYLTGDLSCVTETKEEVVQGSSMEPLIHNGEMITASFGYYNCHQFERNDLVIFNLPSRHDPIIKRLVGLPGDKFGLREENGSWLIIINDMVLVNSTQKPYTLSEQRKTILAINANDYGGVIPPNALIVVGDDPNGTIDSTLFGLLNTQTIVAKAILK